MTPELYQLAGLGLLGIGFLNYPYAWHRGIFQNIGAALFGFAFVRLCALGWPNWRIWHWRHRPRKVISEPFPAPSGAEFQIGINGDVEWIRCLRCGMTSYNRHDVEHHYCSNCQMRLAGSAAGQIGFSMRQKVK